MGRYPWRDFGPVCVRVPTNMYSKRLRIQTCVPSIHVFRVSEEGHVMSGFRKTHLQSTVRTTVRTFLRLSFPFLLLFYKYCTVQVPVLPSVRSFKKINSIRTMSRLEKSDTNENSDRARKKEATKIQELLQNKSSKTYSLANAIAAFQPPYSK